MHSNEKNNLFYEACRTGDLNTVKEIYKDYKKFRPIYRTLRYFYFSNYPFFDPHFNSDLCFLTACDQENHEIVDFLLSDKKFLNTVYKEQLKRSFIDCVARNKRNIIKVLLQHIDINIKGEINTDLSLIQQGFVLACEFGELETIKIFISSERTFKNLNLEEIDKKIVIDNKELIYYFLFDLGWGKENKFISNIQNEEIESLLEKKELYETLSNEKELTPKKNKKIKI